MKSYTRIKFLSAFGARVHIHWSALLVMGGILAVSIRNPVMAVITICSYFGIIFLHETGHAYFARQLGYRPYDIYLGFFHGLCAYEQPQSKKHEAIVAWGGVLAQLVVAIPLILLSQTEALENVPGVGPIIAFLGYISAMVAMVNLAPSPWLDGGKAWTLFPILWAESQKKSKNGTVVKGPWDPKKR